ncbi:uncharacterized protein LOC107684837 isoform X3 [Sinocyclocheilus anshuiensis]|uniref:uncharacterized protein LOC107684837 isoform X3 n=1 Tax=Sinocyclocheilus anshuiensis TaxID=1608454 RepID=UPI0007BABCE0|nr:PREDICTED: uncharacterized protein LOC107684837 isoform X3 [Sinocyclocheilus anshuiensis]
MMLIFGLMLLLQTAAYHPVALIILGSLAVILIVLVIIAYYVYKKKNQLKPTNVENASSGPQTNRNEKKEQELHYGEVTFTDRKVQQQPSKTQEECLYAQVQTR